MPVLPREICLFPSDLLEESTSRLADDSQWWVLRTKPRSEKSLARRLVDDRQAFYLPTYEKILRRAGKSVRSYLPLFPGYLFLYGSESASRKVYGTKLIAQILSAADQTRLDGDLVRIHRMLASGAPVAPIDRIGPGSCVEIVNGPLAGLTGRVLRRGKKLRLMIEVDFLQQGAAVEIESWMLEPIEPPRRTGVSRA